MAGLQCHKRLYLQTYWPELTGAADQSAEAILEAGHSVGALARNRFPRGTLVSENLDWTSAERSTREALKDRTVPAIFEPAIGFDGVRIRADVLARAQRRRFDLIEVKSTLDAKPEHEWDLAIQYHVLRGAGIPVRWARLMHLNRDYVYPGGNYDLKRLFKLRNLTHLVRKRRRKIIAAIQEMRKVLRSRLVPVISVGPQCTAPYTCPFLSHCHDGEPEHSIEQLPRLGVGLRKQLAAMGIIEIDKIPEDFDGLSILHARVVEAVRTETRFHDPAIERAGRALQKAGIIVEDVHPPIDQGERLWWEFQGADGNQMMFEALGEAIKQSRPRLRDLIKPEESKSAVDFLKIAFARDAWRVQLAQFMERYPVILGPVFCTSAFPHEATELEVEGKLFAHFLAGWPVAWGNCAGVPGVSVPIGLDCNGLPIGLQINARPFHEETALAIARVVESECGGYQRPPL